MDRLVTRVTSIIGTAGHVDHGKSTLVTALTGIETDRLAEEKRRGVSIELGFAYFDFSRASVEDPTPLRASIVDVPGHARFLNTMLRGATGVDVALLVVAADDGVMPQTVEHLDILHLLGVSAGVVVITKIDLVTAGRVAEVETQIFKLIANTSLQGAEILRYSSVESTGLEGVKESLASVLLKKNRDKEQKKRTAEDEFFRLPIDRSFAVKGFGTVVTGSVASGVVKAQEYVQSFPGAKKLKVRGIESLGSSVDSAERGTRAALNLSGIGYKELAKGTLLTSVELAPYSIFAQSKKRQRADAAVGLLENIPGVRAVQRVKNNSLLKLHHLTGSSLVRIRFNEKAVLFPGEHAKARLLFTTPLLLLRSDRFILRDPATNSTVGGGTIGGAYITKLLPPITAIMPVPVSPNGVGSKEDVYSVLNSLSSMRWVGFALNCISILLNLKEQKLYELLINKDEGRAEEIGFSVLNGYVVKDSVVRDIENFVDKTVQEFHSNFSAQEGIDEEVLLSGLLKEFKSGLGVKSTKEVLKSVLSALVDSGRLVRCGTGRVRLAGFQLSQTGIDSEVEEAIVALLGASGLKSTPKAELIALPFSAERITAAIRFLQKNGTLVEFKRESYLSGTVVESAKELLLDFFLLNMSIEAKEFRDILGCGRKLAIEILEHFDRIKVTLRRGDERILR